MSETRRPLLSIAPARRWCAVLILATVGAFAQAPGSNPSPAPQTAGDPAQTPEAAAATPQPVLKTIAIDTVKDQRMIWTGPFHMKRSDAKWWIGFTAATAALIATDRTTRAQLPDTKDQVRFSNDISHIGEYYVLYPAMGAVYLTGVLTDNPKAKETGQLGVEALTDAVIVSSVLKLVTGRERPSLTNGNANWFKFGNYSMPSGHSIMSFAAASLIVHEYPQHKAVPVIAYTVATAVSLSRFSGRDHWPSDILAGGAMGYFIGAYVYHKRSGEAIRQGPVGRLRPDRVGPYVNEKTASVGLGVAWDIGSRWLERSLMP